MTRLAPIPRAPAKSRPRKRKPAICGLCKKVVLDADKIVYEKMAFHAFCTQPPLSEAALHNILRKVIQEEVQEAISHFFCFAALTKL